MWWRDDLQRRHLVEQPGIDQPRHAGRRLVRPAEGEPDFILRPLLGRVIGELRSAHRMHPDRQIELDHAFEDRPEFRRAERLAGDIGEHLDAPGAQVSHRAVDLLQRGVDVVHRQRRDKGWKALRMPPADVGKTVIGDARQLRGALGRPQQFERRIGERQHLAVVAELIEQLESRVEVPQRRQLGKRGGGRVIRHELPQFLEVSRRQEVVVDVEDQLKAPGFVALKPTRSRGTLSSRSLSRGETTCLSAILFRV